MPRKKANPEEAHLNDLTDDYRAFLREWSKGYKKSLPSHSDVSEAQAITEAGQDFFDHIRSGVRTKRGGALPIQTRKVTFTQAMIEERIQHMRDLTENNLKRCISEAQKNLSPGEALIYIKDMKAFWRGQFQGQAQEIRKTLGQVVERPVIENGLMKLDLQEIRNSALKREGRGGKEKLRQARKPLPARASSESDALGVMMLLEAVRTLRQSYQRARRAALDYELGRTGYPDFPRVTQEVAAAENKVTRDKVKHEMPNVKAGLRTALKPFLSNP